MQQEYTVSQDILENQIPGLNQPAAKFTKPGNVIQPGNPPFSIDLVPAIVRAGFAEANQNKVDVDLERLKASFIGYRFNS